MKKRLICVLCAAALLLGALAGCGGKPETVKIGVSFGAGPAARWPMEIAYMEEYAAELGIEIDARLNLKDSATTQDEDCLDLIDSDIDALILMPRDATATEPIVQHALDKKVPVVDYARAIQNQPVDIFVGYDCGRIGQAMGQYLAETVYTGDYILLQGEPTDTNAVLLYEGAMRYIEPIKKDINIILDAAVPGWQPEAAKQMVKEAVTANGGKVDAILAPNDALAGACAEALDELGVTQPVVITGMDAELAAVRRIVNGRQDITFYMDLREMARIAVDEALHLARGEKLGANAEFPTDDGGLIPSHLITGQVITEKNIDKLLIETGYFTHDEVYAP